MLLAVFRAAHVCGIAPPRAALARVFCDLPDRRRTCTMNDTAHTAATHAFATTSLREVVNEALAAYGAHDWTRAEALCRQGLAERAQTVQLLTVLGAITLQTGRPDEAAECFGRVVGLTPESADALNNQGTALAELNRLEQALAAFDAAIELAPGLASAHSNRGLALRKLGRLEAALASLDRAIVLEPRMADAHFNRGLVLEVQRRLPEAVASFEQAIALDPDRNYLLGILVHTRMFMCDWRDLDRSRAVLQTKVMRGERACYPLPFSALVDSPAAQRRCAEVHVAACHPPDASLGPLVPKPPAADRRSGSKIRIGYFSADFRNHAVSFLAAELFELHDRTQFEVIAFAFGPDVRDATRTRLERAFDRFVDVRGHTDREVALLSRSMGIDIAVDLGGFTQDSRTGIFAARAAPVQVSYLGYLGTMGAPYIDYLLADRTLIPSETRPHYCEKIAYLPSYQINDRRRVIAARTFSRAELGLPDAGFVFCSFSNNYKIVPETFDSWMRILCSVDGSVLVLLADNPWAEANLKREAQARGVDPGRLVFGQRLPIDEYLARYRAFDLFLDTLPYNAGATASDALWAGLPVLTCMGQSFPARMAASIVRAAGLPELVVASRQAYEDLAVALARESAPLAALRRRLAGTRGSMRLFDALGTTRSIEEAYRRMLEPDR